MAEQQELSDEQKRKKSQLKEQIMVIEMVLGVVNNGIERHKRSVDPVMRSTLLVDKLCTIVDLGLVAMTLNHENLPDELKERMRDSADSIKKELDFLLDWISNPQYSPDHAYGNAVMKGASNNFNINANTNPNG